MFENYEQILEYWFIRRKALYIERINRSRVLMQLRVQYYENVLHRSTDQAGLDFWTGALDSHAATSAQVLAAISESRENIDGTAALIGNGLVLDQPLMT